MRQLPLLATLLAISPVTLAGSFSPPFDARSYAMGGTGVGSARASSAAAFNPAMLALQKESDDFSMILPGAGVTVTDEQELNSKLDDLDAALTQLNNDIQAFSAAVENVSSAELAAIGQSARSLQTELVGINRNAMGVDGGVMFGFAVPKPEWAWGFQTSGRFNLGVINTVADSDLTLLDSFANVLADGTVTTAEVSDSSLITSTAGVISISNPDSTGQYNSYVEAVGMGILEIAIPVATQIQTRSLGTLSIGITPKFMRVETVYYRQIMSSGQDTLDNFDAAENRREYSDFNLDAGAALFLDAEKNWTAGLSIKNLIPREYDTNVHNSTRYTLHLRPQAAIGIGGRWKYGHVAADLDLTRNQGEGFLGDTQYLSLGTEADFRFVQVRAGYKHNIAESDVKNIVTAGLGLGPLDISALYGDGKTAGVVMQLAFSF